MFEFGKCREQRELKELVSEASRALARLDADRLEEMALSCQALNRDLPLPAAPARAALAIEAREAADEMAVFARVIEATRANLQVMNRLRELRAGMLEYGEPQSRAWARPESGHGDN
jgi:porphobilinogen deaminase